MSELLALRTPGERKAYLDGYLAGGMHGITVVLQQLNERTIRVESEARIRAFVEKQRAHQQARTKCPECGTELEG